MDPLTLGLLYGGGSGLLGLFKAAHANKEAKKDYLLASDIAKFSPWTGLNPGDYTPKGGKQNPLMSGLEGAMKGGISGYAQGQAFENSNLLNRKINALANATDDVESDFAGLSMEGPMAAMTGKIADRPRRGKMSGLYSGWGDVG